VKKKTVKKKKKPQRKRAAVSNKPVERKLLEVQLHPRDVPVEVRDQWLQKGQSRNETRYVQGTFDSCSGWALNMIEGPVDDVRDRLEVLKKWFPDYERVEVAVDVRTVDYDWHDVELSVVGYRWETDEEYEKRKAKLLKQRAAQRQRRAELKKKQAEDKRRAALKKKQAEKQAEDTDYEKYLELKKRYEND